MKKTFQLLETNKAIEYDESAVAVQHVGDGLIECSDAIVMKSSSGMILAKFPDGSIELQRVEPEDLKSSLLVTITDLTPPFDV